jgi:hypothetical protein
VSFALVLIEFAQLAHESKGPACSQKRDKAGHPPQPDLQALIKTINLKADMPSVAVALERLERELVLARKEKALLLKLIHGYGSSGAGGDIRIAVQRRLIEMVEAGAIQGCIFGEDWSKSDDQAWKLVRQQPELKNDPDLGRGNCGITVVVL